MGRQRQRAQSNDRIDYDITRSPKTPVRASSVAAASNRNSNRDVVLAAEESVRSRSTAPLSPRVTVLEVRGMER